MDRKVRLVIGIGAKAIGNKQFLQFAEKAIEGGHRVVFVQPSEVIPRSFGKIKLPKYSSVITLTTAQKRYGGLTLKLFSLCARETGRFEEKGFFPCTLTPEDISEVNLSGIVPWKQSITLQKYPTQKWEGYFFLIKFIFKYL